MLYGSVGCDSFPPLAFSEAGVDAALGDKDQDGWSACPPTFTTEQQELAQCDCDDADSDVHPQTWYLDVDADGEGSLDESRSFCKSPAGFVANADDCDDQNPAIFSGAIETCDGVDQNCSGDEADAEGLWFVDADGDGHGDPTRPATLTGCPSSGYAQQGDDCDDTNPTISPGAPEICNTRDDNCNGISDEEATDAPGWCLDADRDGFGSSSDQIKSCTPPESRYTALCSDCDDATGSVNPWATERCNDSVDNDCNGVVNDCPLLGTVSVDEADTRISTKGATLTDVGDTDGDGRHELLVGDKDADGEGGKVYLFRDIPGGTISSQAAQVVFTSNTHYQTDFGESVGRAGDLNGDGLEDVALHMGYQDELLLYLAPFSNTVPLASAELRMYGCAGTRPIAGLGDIDGDRRGDLLIGNTHHTDTGGDYIGAAYIFTGLPEAMVDTSDALALLSGEFHNELFGNDVSSAGDVNADGVQDIAVSAPSNPGSGERRGTVHIFFGPFSGEQSRSQSDITIEGESDEDRLGTISTGGDLNGDGYADIVMAASYSGRMATEGGAVYVFYGPLEAGYYSASAADAVISGALDYYQAGYSIDSGGDFDGDGYADLLIGAPCLDDRAGDETGQVYLFYGPILGDVSTLQADVTFVETTPLQNMGVSVAFIGDMTEDGTDELSYSAPAFSNNQGGSPYIAVFLGGTAPGDSASVIPGLLSQ